MNNKFNLKSTVIGFIIGCLVTATIPIFASSTTVQAVYNDIKVKVNGEAVAFASGEEPVIIDGKTYTPTKAVAEALGANVTWNSSDKTVQITSNETTTNKTSGEVNTTSMNTTGTKLPSFNVPEIDSSNNPNLITKLSDGDDFEIITYKNCSAIKYNDNIYVKGSEVLPKHNIKFKISGKNNALKLFQNDNLILETLDANYINYIYYNAIPYFNITFLGEYLED